MKKSNANRKKETKRNETHKTPVELTPRSSIRWGRPIHQSRSGPALAMASDLSEQVFGNAPLHGRGCAHQARPTPMSSIYQPTFWVRPIALSTFLGIRFLFLICFPCFFFFGSIDRPFISPVNRNRPFPPAPYQSRNGKLDSRSLLLLLATLNIENAGKHGCILKS